MANTDPDCLFVDPVKMEMPFLTQLRAELHANYTYSSLIVRRSAPVFMKPKNLLEAIDLCLRATRLALMNEEVMEGRKNIVTAKIALHYVFTLLAHIYAAVEADSCSLDLLQRCTVFLHVIYNHFANNLGLFASSIRPTTVPDKSVQEIVVEISTLALLIRDSLQQKATQLHTQANDHFCEDFPVYEMFPMEDVSA